MNTNEHHEGLGVDANAASGTTRRAWLKSAGRYGALLGLLGGVGTLAARTACRKAPCGECPLLARCDLSKAQEARAAWKREGRS